VAKIRITVACTAAVLLAAPLLPVRAAALEDSSSALTQPGATAVLRRLNRLEYVNSLRDLFGIEFPFATELPADSVTAGFDNIGAALAVSPVLLESYLKAARKASSLVLGIGNTSAVTEQFPVTRSQFAWVPGMPLGTRGGVRVKYYFPHDGRYELRAFLDSGQAFVKGALARINQTPVEGVRLFRARVAVSAGQHTFIATFPDEYAEHEGAVPNIDGPGGRAVGGPVDTRGSAILPTLQFWLDGKSIRTFSIHGPAVGEAALGAQPGPPILMRAEISGPFEPSSVSDTPARRNLFICVPRRASAESACASKILARVARRAYRRELSDDDMLPLLAAFARKRATAGFDEAIGMGLRTLLMSPDFLFRVERDPPDVQPGQVYRIGDEELATRLSYFLWSSLPDEELLQEAQAGRLHDPANLRREARRMLADPRADALVSNFAFQWLGLRDLDAAHPDLLTYPQFDSGLAGDFAQETRLFLNFIFTENRSVLEVISSNYAFLNERLATLYGVPGVHGDAFRRVELRGNEDRGGILGQGSVLMVTSHAATTSPILRGKWVLTSLLNSPPPAPPPGVPPLDVSPASDGHQLTTREQIERHRTSPVCIACHAKMDPYGFAMENYDVLGQWRTEENASPIDASASLPHGTPFAGPAGLKQVLLERSQAFVMATVSRLLTYALGRPLERGDEPLVREIAQNAAPAGYLFQDLVEGVVNSQLFQSRRAGQDPARQVTVAQEHEP
jgi:hypothetical protein